MVELLTDDDLAQIHKVANTTKRFCYFTGFIEGIVASGFIEADEVEPLVAQCMEFLRQTVDDDAKEILEDYSADLLEFETLEDFVEIRLNNIDAECEKSTINRFFGFCAGIACDDKITLNEAAYLIEKFGQNSAILADPPSRSLVSVCLDAVDDGVISTSESVEICKAITRIVGDAYCDTGVSSLGNVPVFDAYKIDVDFDFSEKQIVLTGDFSIKPRRILEDELSARGAIIKKSVSRKTDFVLVASEASRDWVYTHKGTKLNKALALRETEDVPDFLSEANLLSVLGLR